jgi:hypothetical protein
MKFKLPRYHKCNEIIREIPLKTSFNQGFLVDYCEKCDVYIYKWGRDDKVGIETGNVEKIIKYIEDSQKIIKKIHIQNIEKIN